MRKLSIIIPVYNEANTIDKILHKVLKQRVPGWIKEIIIVDDGSNDKTKAIVFSIIKEYKNKPSIIFIKQTHQGRGKALRSGIAASSGEAIVFQDADLEYDPKDLPNIVKEFNDPNVLVVYGSRTLKPKHRGYLAYVFGDSVLTYAVNHLFNLKLTDLYTGYKSFRSFLIKSIPLSSNGFEFEAELTVKLLKQEVKIKEIPIDYYPRTFAQGKKMMPWDGIKGLIAVLKYYLD